MTNSDDKAEQKREYGRAWRAKRIAADPSYADKERQKARESYYRRKAARKQEAAVYAKFSTEEKAMSNTGKIINKPTFIVGHEIINAIGANGKKFDNGTFKYNDGWSDARIAGMFGVSSNVVGTRRVGYYGPFIAKRSVPVVKKDADDARIPALEAEIAALKEQLAAAEKAAAEKVVEKPDNGSDIESRLFHIESRLNIIEQRLPIHAGDIAALKDAFRALKNAFGSDVDKLTARANQVDVSIGLLNEAARMCLSGMTYGRNSVDPRKLQELQNYYNNPPKNGPKT